MAFATRPTAVNRTRWTIDASHGELLVHTGVRGRAAKLGHRLTIVVNAWYAKVSWSDDVPVAVDFAAEVDSLEVVRGDGGVKALSAPEKLVATSNALRSLDARRFPRITFRANAVEPTDHGYRLTGTLGIRDRSRECVVDLHVEDLDDSWVLSCEVVVRQSEFGIKPYSLMLGAIAVEDDVTVSFTARRAKDG